MKYDDPFFVHRDIRDGLIGEWNLGEDISQVVDLSGKGNNGAIVGASRISDNNLGSHKVLKFDGVDDSVNFGNVGVGGENKITIVSLFKPDLITTNSLELVLRVKGSPVDNSVLSFERPNGTNILRFKVSTNEVTNALFGDYTFLNTEYIFAVGVFEGGVCSFYINGELIDSGNLNGNFLYGELELVVGAYNSIPQFSFKGNIALTRIYNQILSLDKIQTLYKFIYKKYGVLEGFND